MAIDAASQSPTVIVPSAFSAMICRVRPLLSKVLTRTMRKPRSRSAGAMMLATRAATPVSLTRRGSSMSSAIPAGAA